MQQIVVIHGGNSFETNWEFLQALLSEEVTLQWRKEKRWKALLQQNLGTEYEVIRPRMPRSYHAKYVEWKRAFEELIPQIRDNVIFIGHSLGGVFLAKYLSEETHPKKIRAVFLVAAPYDKDGERKIAQFVLPMSLKRFEQQAPIVVLYHSKDDPVVAFSELEKYQRALPAARVRTFVDREHFNQRELQEIINDIKELR